MKDMIKKFIGLNKWFNRKSQHYVFGNWWEYLNIFDDFKPMIKYVRYYPIAYIKFMWLCKNEIIGE